MDQQVMDTHQYDCGVFQLHVWPQLGQACVLNKQSGRSTTVSLEELALCVEQSRCWRKAVEA